MRCGFASVDGTNYALSKATKSSKWLSFISAEKGVGGEGANEISWLAGCSGFKGECFDS